eukprot:jgi/Psemu1/8591/gm1.8591_g
MQNNSNLLEAKWHPLHPWLRRMHQDSWGMTTPVPCKSGLLTHQVTIQSLCSSKHQALLQESNNKGLLEEPSYYYPTPLPISSGSNISCTDATGVCGAAAAPPPAAAIMPELPEKQWTACLSNVAGARKMKHKQEHEPQLRETNATTFLK